METPGGGGYGNELDDNDDVNVRRKRLEGKEEKSFIEKSFIEKGSVHAYRLLQESA